MDERARRAEMARIEGGKARHMVNRTIGEEEEAHGGGREEEGDENGRGKERRKERRKKGVKE